MRGIDYVFLILILGVYGVVVWLWLTMRKEKAQIKKEGDTVETIATEEKNEPDDSDVLYMGTNGLYSIEAYNINARKIRKHSSNSDAEFEKMIREVFENE
jgi:hypothetical protein